MSWFEGKSTKQKKAAVKNAIAVMMVDGKVDQRELAFLAKVCGRVGMDLKQLKKLLEAPEKVKFTVPDSREERVFQLMDMVFMMMADGKIDQREMDLCMTLATRLGFPPSAIPTMMNSLVRGIEKGQARNQVSVEIGSYLMSK